MDTGDGRVFDYWHIGPEVSVGDHVQAGETNLGSIRAPFEHVHLSEQENGRIVNPLQVGHLTPYEDTTVALLSAQLACSSHGGWRLLGAGGLSRIKRLYWFVPEAS